MCNERRTSQIGGIRNAGLRVLVGVGGRRECKFGMTCAICTVGRRECVCGIRLIGRAGRV